MVTPKPNPTAVYGLDAMKKDYAANFASLNAATATLKTTNDQNVVTAAKLLRMKHTLEY
jgi:hypothetical protein